MRFKRFKFNKDVLYCGMAAVISFGISAGSGSFFLLIGTGVAGIVMVTIVAAHRAARKHIES